MYVNVCLARHLKEELAWAIDKRLWLIIINNQVLRKIKIAVENDVKNWAYLYKS